MGIKKRHGHLSLGGIKKAFNELPEKVKECDQYGKELVVDAVEYEDGNIKIDVYNKVTGENINLGRLMISKFNNNG